MAEKNKHAVALGGIIPEEIIPVTDLQIGEYGIVVGDLGHQNGRIVGRLWAEHHNTYSFFALDNPGSTFRSGVGCSLQVRKLRLGETINLVVGK